MKIIANHPPNFNFDYEYEPVLYHSGDETFDDWYRAIFKNEKIVRGPTCETGVKMLMFLRQLKDSGYTIQIEP